MDAMLWGFISLTIIIIAFCCLFYKKYLCCLLCSISSFIPIGLTGYHWFLMLEGSGKNTSLLGFSRYPAALIILLILFLLSVSSTIISFVLNFHSKRKMRGKKEVLL